eukprot:628472-Pyramimonas_sp.AAC.1
MVLDQASRGQDTTNSTTHAPNDGPHAKEEGQRRPESKGPQRYKHNKQFLERRQPLQYSNFFGALG